METGIGPVLVTALQEAIVPLVVALVGALAAWVTAAVKRLVDAQVARVENETARVVMAQVADAVSKAVEATSQTLVDDLRARSVDGKLTRDDAKLAAATALEAAWASLSETARAHLSRLVSDPKRVLQDAIEATVHERKASRPLTVSEREAELEALRQTTAALLARGA